MEVNHVGGIEFETVSSVAQFFGIKDIAVVTELDGGLINKTYCVQTVYGHLFIVQKMNKIFRRSVMDDMFIVTNRLRDLSILSPHLLRDSKSDKPYKIINGDCWRMMTYIDGITLENNISLGQARSAGHLMGTFHSALVGWSYYFHHELAGFHNTQDKIKKLRLAMEDFKDTEKYKMLEYEINYVLQIYELNRHYWAIEKTLPKRIIHGDPKINNIRFDFTGKKAIAMLDLDTIGCHPVVFDIADASRSWCNTKGEDGGGIKFDVEIFGAMLDGYMCSEASNFITDVELFAIPGAISKMMIELSARFLTDALRESYFKLDVSRYRNLFEQNHYKALVQIELYKSFMTQQSNVKSIVYSYLTQKRFS